MRKLTNRLLSLRVFGLLSSSLLLFPQRLCRYVLRSSSGVCRTREPTRNFELRPLLNPRGSPVLIPLAIHTPEEGRRTYRPRRCGNNNKDEDNSPKTLYDKNHQASSQKFKQLITNRHTRANNRKNSLLFGFPVFTILSKDILLILFFLQPRYPLKQIKINQHFEEIFTFIIFPEMFLSIFVGKLLRCYAIHFGQLNTVPIISDANLSGAYFFNHCPN